MSANDRPVRVEPLPDPEHDAVAAALTAALEHDAATLQPHDRLTALRAAADRRRSRPWLVAAACAATVAVLGAVAVEQGDRHGGASTPPAVAATSGTKATASSPPSSPSGTESPPALVGTVPVYYLGQDGTRLALFREFHHTDVSIGRLQAAINEATNPVAPLDSDLSAPWGPGPAKVTVNGRGGAAVTIDLPASAGVANGRTPQQAALAAQQLVWTASAVEQDAHLHVQLLIDGHAGRLFGALPVGTVMQRTIPGYLVLGSIWIEAPAEGQTVDSPVTVRGSACTFEANVAWQLLSGDRVVRSGRTTASIGCPDRGTWSVSVGDLAAGSYTFRAFEPPASGEGPDRQDTRTFTVR